MGLADGGRWAPPGGWVTVRVYELLGLYRYIPSRVGAAACHLQDMLQFAHAHLEFPTPCSAEALGGQTAGASADRSVGRIRGYLLNASLGVSAHMLWDDAAHCSWVSCAWWLYCVLG